MSAQAGNAENRRMIRFARSYLPKRVMEVSQDRGHRLKFVDICMVTRASVLLESRRLGFITEGNIFESNYLAKEGKKISSVSHV